MTQARPIPRAVDSGDPVGARYVVARVLQDIPQCSRGAAELLDDGDNAIEVIPLCACNSEAQAGQLIVAYTEPQFDGVWHLHLDTEATNGCA